MLQLLDGMLRRHPWHIGLLNSQSDTFPAVPFVYLLSCCASETILCKLDRAIKRISFYDIRQPEWASTDKLHELRQHLSALRMSMAEAEYHVPINVEEFFVKLKQNPRNNIYHGRSNRTPRERLRGLIDEANMLHAFVLETFNTLIGTIAVLDSKENRKQSEENLKQTRQTVLLTSLAIVYPPLSLATSVFGMNLREMTGSGSQVWAFVGTALALVIATMALISTLFRVEMRSVIKRLTRRSSVLHQV